ncbi:MAG: glycosyltransferase involved in cell wall biosynthesis [Lentisphaeria bacterium]|jgi:glycosyltransferase involved in cell wall biosynthesis
MSGNTRLKIVHVLLSKGFAGSERSTSESCNRQSLEHDVTLVLRKDHRKNDVSVVDHLNGNINIVEISPRWFTCRELRLRLAHIKPDVIHCHLRRSTRLVAKIDPTAATVSTLHIDANGPHFMKMDGLICNARWQIENLPLEYTGQTHKAHNSLVSHRRLSIEEIQKLRAELNVNNDDILVGAVGRYHVSKGWDTLIEAFKSIEADSARLVFLGAGSDEAKLKALAGNDNRIKFAGYRKDVKDLYQCFDLMVCPSRFEPLPRVMLEGYDAGVAMIASDTGGCKELIEDYGGLMFQTGNVDDLSKILKQALSHPEPKRQIDLSSHYVENANGEIVKFYRRLIEKKRK